MKITMTHKVAIAAIVGVGTAYLLYKKPVKKKGSKNANDKSASNSSNNSSSSEMTNNDKVEYILDNLHLSNDEEMSGFSGKRFYYNPKLGYSLPKGRMPMAKAGVDMDIPRNGKHQEEIYFSAEGSDPAVEAIKNMFELNPEQIDLAYNVVKKNVKDKTASLVDLVRNMDIDDESKKIFADTILPILKDVKALKKNPNWGSSWENRKDKKNKTNKGVFNVYKIGGGLIYTGGANGNNNPNHEKKHNNNPNHGKN